MKLKRIVALCLTLAMLLAVFTACGKTDTPEAEKPTNDTNVPSSDNSKPNDEEVVLTVWAHCWEPTLGLGEQHDPRMDKLAEETGVRLSVYDNNNGANEAEQLATMRASNDLPDIFYVPNMETMQQLIEAGQVLELSEYWNEKDLPNLCGEGAAKSKIQDFMSNFKFDGQRYCVSLWGETGGEDQPTVGFYIPWELYKEAGYPEVNNLDDMVDVIDTLVKLHPETADGQKVYGAGAWFAEGGTWGSWCVDQILLATGYELKGDFTYTFDLSTNNIKDTCTITDPDSEYWKAVEFWYNLNKRGLLDPDSITQKTDQWQEKAYSGRYILSQPGWETTALKNGAGMSWIALKPFTDYITLDWSSETDGNMYAISSTCANPEAALKVLDYIASAEGSRLLYSGIEGEAWEMVDGKAQYTEQYNSDVKSLSSAELATKYGEMPGHFVGYQLNVISKLDNSAYDLTYTPEYRASSFGEVEQDAFEFYGVTNLREIYTKDTKGVVYRHSEYTSNMSALPDDLQKNSTDLQNFVLGNYLSCVFANSDEEFAAAKQAIIEGAADYNAEGLYRWYKEEFARVKPLINPYLSFD